MDGLIPRLVARFATPLILALALYLFLRGHHNPGGGFIAGLVAASAIVLQAVVWSREDAIRYLPVPGWVFIGLGLAFGAGTGIGGIVLGVPFLTHSFGPFHLGSLEVELATAQLFDLGVFLVVVGTTQSVILNLSGDPVIHPGTSGGRGEEEGAAGHQAGGSLPETARARDRRGEEGGSWSS